MVGYILYYMLAMTTKIEEKIIVKIILVLNSVSYSFQTCPVSYSMIICNV